MNAVQPSARPTGDQSAVPRSLVIMIPAYNEAGTIGELLDQLPRDVAGFDSVIPLVIDDGSSDDTAAIASEHGARVVRHGRNLGLAAAFRTSIQAALDLGADVAVGMDADLQFSPADILELIQPILDDEADLVVGNRFGDGGRPKNMPRVKYLGNQLMTGVVNRLSGGRFTDVSCGYRAYSREALLNVNVQSSFTYTQETFIELFGKGLRICQVPIEVRYFPDRRSYISGNLLNYATRTLLTIGRATRDFGPFKVFGTMSAVLMIPGILVGIFVLYHYIATGSFSPYIFLAFTAIYLFTLGFGLLVLAFVADMLRGIRANQERMLYLEKYRRYERIKSGEASGGVSRWGN